MERFFSLLLVSLFAGCAIQASPPTYPNPRFQNLDLVSTDGEPLQAGGTFAKPTLIYIFDNTCPHCREATKGLETWVLKEVDRQRIDVIGVGRGHDAQALREWKSQENISFPVVGDPGRRITDVFAPPGVPSFYLINDAQELVARVTGWSEAWGDTLVADLQYLASGKAVDAKEVRIRRLTALAGIDTALEALPGVLTRALQNRELELPPLMYDKLRRLFAGEYDRSEMEALLVESLSGAMSFAAVEEAADWYARPLGRRIAALDDRAYEPGYEEGLMKFLEQLDRSPPAPERIALLSRIDDAMRITQTGMAVETATAVGYLAAMDMLRPRDQRLGLSRIQAMVEREIQADAVNRKRANVAQLLYDYRELTDSQLRDYLQFLTTPAGDRFAQGAAEGFSRGMLRWNARVLRELPKLQEQFRGYRGV